MYKQGKQIEHMILDEEKKKSLGLLLNTLCFLNGVSILSPVPEI